jgi:uncharacterized protein YlzI (FlbEa/FlbD family)
MVLMPLTRPEGKPVFVNPEHIVQVYAIPGGTNIYTITGSLFAVRETTAWINEWLEKHA